MISSWFQYVTLVVLKTKSCVSVRTVQEWQDPDPFRLKYFPVKIKSFPALMKSSPVQISSFLQYTGIRAQFQSSWIQFNQSICTNEFPVHLMIIATSSYEWFLVFRKKGNSRPHPNFHSVGPKLWWPKLSGDIGFILLSSKKIGL